MTTNNTKTTHPIIQYANQKKLYAFLALGGVALTSLLDLHIGTSGFMQETIIGFGSAAASNFVGDALSPITQKNVLADETKAYVGVEENKTKTNMKLGAIMALVGLCAEHLAPKGIAFNETIQYFLSAGVWGGAAIGFGNLATLAKHKKVRLNDKIKSNANASEFTDEENISEILDLEQIDLRNPTNGNMNGFLNTAFKLIRLSVNLRHAVNVDIGSDSLFDPDKWQEDEYVITDEFEKSLNKLLKYKSKIEAIDFSFSEQSELLSRTIHQKLNYMPHYIDFINQFSHGQFDEALFTIDHYKEDYATQRNSLGFKKMTELELLTLIKIHTLTDENDVEKRENLEKKIQAVQQVLTEVLDNKNIGSGYKFNQPAMREFILDSSFDNSLMSLAFSHWYLENEEKAFEFFDKQASKQSLEKIMDDNYGYSNGYNNISWLYEKLNQDDCFYESFIEDMAVYKNLDLEKMLNNEYKTIVYIDNKDTVQTNVDSTVEDSDTTLRNKISQNRVINPSVEVVQKNESKAKSSLDL